jgi:Fe-S-cluster-containing dehydrogenase component
MTELDQMMKCDHCYDRTSVGLAPMCASVCPSQALWFGTPEEFHATRAGELEDTFVFGTQVVKTKVRTVVHETGPVTISVGRTKTHWLDDPFGLDEQPAAPEPEHSPEVTP